MTLRKLLLYPYVLLHCGTVGSMACAGRQCLVAFLALLLSLMPGHNPAAQDGSSGIRIAGSGWIADAPTKIADALDYFDQQGTAAELKYYSSGKAALQALLDGEVDFALAATTPFAKALLADRSPRRPDPDDLVALATVSHSNSTHHILAAPGRSIGVPGDLVGHRVGVLEDSSADYFWSLFADLYEIPEAAVESVDMSIAEMRDALVDGKVDAIVAWEPWISELHEHFDQQAVIFTDRHMYTVNWLLLTHRATCETQARICRSVLDAYKRAIDFIYENQDAARQLQSEVAGIDVATIERFEDQVIYRLALDWGALRNIEMQFDWFYDTKRVAGHRPSPSLYLMPGPLASVAAERVLVPRFLETSSR